MVEFSLLLTFLIELELTFYQRTLNRSDCYDHHYDQKTISTDNRFIVIYTYSSCWYTCFKKKYNFVELTGFAEFLPCVHGPKQVPCWDTHTRNVNRVLCIFILCV